MSDEVDLDPRSRDIIKALVEEYVHSGEAVASRKIAAKSGINLSSASVRTVLAKLEERGLIEQVHTSSGRRPTVEGMHVYLDSLLSVKAPPPETVRALAGSIRTESTNSMAHSAMEGLADITRLISLVSLPSISETKLAKLHFVRISSQRVMAVLVSETGEVRNRLIETGADFGARELEQASQLFSEQLAGRTMTQALAELTAMVSSLQTRIADLLKRMLEQIAQDSGEGQQVMTSGLHHGARSSLLDDAKRLSDMGALLESKEALMKLLSQGICSQDVSVFIGVESGVPELADSSVVLAPYRAGESDIVGVLGLIGPINMEYEKVMPIVEVTASLMNEALVRIRSDLN